MIIQRDFFFIYFSKKISCDPTLEPYQRDGFNKGSHFLEIWKSSLNYPCYTLLSEALQKAKMRGWGYYSDA